MPRKYQCSGCGSSHPKPIGNNCATVYNCENSVISVGDSTESVGDAIKTLTTTVQALAQEVSTLRTEVRATPASGITMATSSMTSGTNGLSTVPPANLDTMRASQQLTARVDSAMSADAGLLDLHYLTGGKLMKSPRDAPARKITRSVLWPNQFVTRMQGAAGAVKYDDLTMQELALGVLKIAQLSEVPEDERKARLGHLETVMNLARYYTWPAVRNMYGVVLEDIQYGSLDWSENIQGYRDAHMQPSALLTRGDIPSIVGANRTRHITATNAPAVPEICRKFNFEECPRSPCPYLHVCSACKRYHGEVQNHKAKDCARRSAFLTSRADAAHAPQHTLATNPGYVHAGTRG